MTTVEDDSERISFWDTFNSLTGHEENAIEKAFGSDVSELTMKTFSNSISLAGLRAMAFIVEKRKGTPKPYEVVMNMTRKDLADRFKSEEEDADDAVPEDPDTDQGKLV